MPVAHFCYPNNQWSTNNPNQKKKWFAFVVRPTQLCVYPNFEPRIKLSSQCTYRGVGLAKLTHLQSGRTSIEEIWRSLMYSCCVEGKMKTHIMSSVHAIRRCTYGMPWLENGHCQNQQASGMWATTGSFTFSLRSMKTLVHTLWCY